MASWINPVAEAMKQFEGEQIWDFDYTDVAAELKEVSKLISVELTLYQCRHSGPSIDRANGERDIGEVRKRGGWKAWKSLARYEKSARLANTFERLTEAQKTFFRTCEGQLAAFMSGRDVEIALPEF